MKTRGKQQSLPLNEVGFAFKWQMLFYKHNSHTQNTFSIPHMCHHQANLQSK